MPRLYGRNSTAPTSTYCMAFRQPSPRGSIEDAVPNILPFTYTPLRQDEAELCYTSRLLEALWGRQSGPHPVLHLHLMG